MKTEYELSNYGISEDKLRANWEEQERLEKQRVDYIGSQRELQFKHHSFPTRPNETADGEPVHKIHQEQDLWMQYDEKNGTATYNRPAKSMTRLEIMNAQSELKDIEGSIKGLVNQFKQLEARKQQLRTMLGLQD